MIFGAPHNWKLDGSKLIKDYETEEYKAAVGFVRDLNTAGLFHPNSLTYNITSARQDFAASRFVVHVEGYAPWNDFWRQGRGQNPPANFGMLYPFAAYDGGKPQYNLYQGYIAANALKKASPERIKELLRIMNWLAAPFGSQEDMLLSYGIKDVHYTLDDKGNPKPTQVGNAEAGFVPWRYISQRPQVIYMADIPGYVEAAVEAEKRLVPIGITDPTLGHYSTTQSSKGAQVQLAMLDGVRDIVAGRRPFSDYDQIVKDWASAGGEQIRQEYLRAISGAQSLGIYVPLLRPGHDARLAQRRRCCAACSSTASPTTPQRTPSPRCMRCASACSAKPSPRRTRATTPRGACGTRPSSSSHS